MSSFNHYGLRHYLKASEALKYIEALTGAELESYELARLVIEDRLPVYVHLGDCGEGWLMAAGFSGQASPPWSEDTGYGLVRVVSGIDSIRGENQLGLGLVFAPTEERPFGIENKNNQPAIAVLTGAFDPVLAAIFLVEDIQRLASLMSVSDESSQSEPPKEKLYQIRQRLILEQFELLGYPPIGYPKNEAGQRGVRYEIRQKLKDDAVFKVKDSFKDTWNALLRDGDIKPVG